MWYPKEIHKQLVEGKEIDQVDVVLRLSVLKPLHAKWIVECYDDVTSGKGNDVIANGWKSAGIMEAPKRGKNGFGDLDPFSDSDPLMESTAHSTDDAQEIASAEQIQQKGYQRVDFENDDNDDEDEIWVDPSYDFPERNIFDVLDDENEE